MREALQFVFRVCGVAALLFALATPFGAAAASKAAAKNAVSIFDRSMHFSIVRSGVGYCEPNCPEWIYGEGQIDGATPGRFRKILKQVGDRKLPLIILSPGGNVQSAIEIGRIVRKRDMAVQVGYTRFGSCRPRDEGCKADGAAPGEFRGIVMVQGAFCWSACPLILAAGDRRVAARSSMIGVHQVTTVYQREKILYKEKYRMVGGERKVISRKILSRKKAGTKVTTKLPKSTRKLLIGYFREMGTDRSLLDMMLSTAPDKIRTLTPDEMLKLHLVSEVSTDDLLADPLACSRATALANCVMRNPEPRTGALMQPPPPQR